LRRLALICCGTRLSKILDIPKEITIAEVTKITDSRVSQPAKISRKILFQSILCRNTLEKHFFNILQLQNIVKNAFLTYFKGGEHRKTVFLHISLSNIPGKHFFDIFQLRNVMKNTFSTLFEAGEPRKTLFRDVSRWNSPGEHFCVLVKIVSRLLLT
jgi:hypothetical protein